MSGARLRRERILGHAGGSDVRVFGESGRLIGTLPVRSSSSQWIAQRHQSADAGDLSPRGFECSAAVKVLFAIAAARGVELRGVIVRAVFIRRSPRVRVWMPLGRKVREIWPSWPW